MTRSLWLDRFTGPDPNKIRSYDITCVYEDIRDATKASVDANAALCGASGVYACWNWPEAPATGRAFADWVNNELKRCDLLEVDKPRVHLNSENDDPAYVAAMLKRWRAHRPTRVTGWTMQSHKSAVYTGIVGTIVQTRVAVLPQCYHGPDNAIVRTESAAEVEAWRDLGVTLVEPMLYAGALGDWWEGTAFIAGRLP